MASTVRTSHRTRFRRAGRAAAVAALVAGGLTAGLAPAAHADLVSCPIPASGVSTDQPEGNYLDRSSIGASGKFALCTSSGWTLSECGAGLSAQQLSNSEVVVNSIEYRQALAVCDVTQLY
ncbi:hypothetical protein [Kutzneria buriramensis]|uniref:Uncharacterized protein n=1 Tax=Kutzneria buriramensis TaxID=1045776 RepID=A0A3E0GZ41_9PSEU|nr:hypothetical protein [Kutzneria buriramensis]REH34926.1 hypothetical protein BCF44_119202 [Kutzneria buriramensis]